MLKLTRYQDLSDWVLLASDQKELCENILGSGMSAYAWSQRHNRNYQSIKRYMRKYRLWKSTGMDTFHDSYGGRPPMIDDAGVINIRNDLRANLNSSTCQNSMTNQFQIRVEKEVAETKKRRGFAATECTVPKKFVREFKATNSFTDVVCQFKTHARIFAESDPRNLYSFAMMNQAFLSEIDACCVFNWDATQYCVNAEGFATIVKCKSEGRDVVPTSLSAGGLGFAIKYYHFHNANGDVAPAVFIVADDTMSEDDLFWEEITGLSHTQLVDASGYLVFTKTRNCNAAFYRWYAFHVVAPFVLKCRNIHKSVNADGTPMRAFVVCDGEASQIQVFQESGLLQLMSETLIDFGKSPASCSAITQASDDSDFFNGSKKKLQRIRETDYIDKGLNARLKEVVGNRVDQDGNPRLTSAKKTLVCNSLQQVVYSIKHVLTPEIVKTGYKRIGQYPLSFLTTMGRCTRPISARDMATMQEAIPDMVAIFRATGNLTEEQMDAAGILSVNDEASNARPKDDRPLHQQRSVIMNADDCVAKYRSYQNYKAAEPERRATAMQQRQAAKEIREKKADEIKARKDIKEAEKLRRSNLTPEERRAEDKIKRAANKEAKRVAAAQNEVQELPENDPDGVIDSDDDDNLFDEQEIAEISSFLPVANI